MASLRTASASCLGCVARRSPLARPTIATSASAFAAVQTQQTRGKKTNRRRDQGVVVRLLEDVTQYGRRDTILRVERGRMRNFWYPNGLAEYMTASRVAELGVPVAEAISQPDPWFVAAHDGVPAETAVKQTVTLRSISTTRAATLLETIIPQTLVFYRKPISADTMAIFGSVSADDVATTLREVLQGSGDEDALLVRVEPRDVRFILPEAATSQVTSGEVDQVSTVDRIKELGRWEVDILVRGSQGNTEGLRIVDPVRKIVEVVATQE
ncbi:hypothetical protein SEUCBS140593_010731 [Sporothrix eucalyptigena]|uniref:Ribosomal protein L9 domain-containing protein n=1 Tax=Sporothrix eucalyptigena TaxID=1812306 RepID=A0ABP0D243_9PEZI